MGRIIGINIASILVIILVAFAISLPGAFSSGPCYPDGQRYVFNGILLHDMIHDGAIFHPYDYNVQFYAHYPATNLPYGPPFFAFVFAAAFSIFGISFSVARMVVAGYLVLAALACLHLMYGVTKDRLASVLAVAAFLLNPVTILCARDPGPELAIAFHSFLTVYFFYHYLEKGKKYYGLFGAVALGLGYLTKQYVIPLALALGLYVIVRKKYRVLLNPETWIAIVILIVLTVPYTLLTFKYPIEGLGFKCFPPLSISLLMGYPKLFVKYIPVLTIGSAVGIIVGMRKKDNLILLCLTWLACWYVFYTSYFGYYIGWRYISSIVPALSIFFAYGFHAILLRARKPMFRRLLIGGLVFWFAFKVVNTPAYFVKGYEEAGRFVAEHPRGKSVLFCGTYDGTFMMGIRKCYLRGGPYVLRGDRELVVRLWFDKNISEKRVRSESDLIRFLNKYQVGYVVLEEGWQGGLLGDEFKLLKKVVSNAKGFRQTRVFPIVTNYKKLIGCKLVIYSFDYKSSEKRDVLLEIPVPSLGRDLELPFRW